MFQPNLVRKCQSYIDGLPGQVLWRVTYPVAVGSGERNKEVPGNKSMPSSISLGPGIDKKLT
jgi:hypothetical protein